MEKKYYQQRQYQHEQESESMILQGNIRMKSDLYTDLNMRNKQNKDGCDIFSSFRFLASWLKRK